MSNVTNLYPQTHPVSHFVRVGHTGQQILEDLHAAGKLSLTRVVFDAAHVDRQGSLRQSLATAGFEIILDTKATELATESSVGSSAQALPWATGKVMHVQDWMGGHAQVRTERIAEFAVARRVDAILSPSHFINRPSSPWLRVDARNVVRLRESLNRIGGEKIRIDYHLALPISLLPDPDLSRQLVSCLAPLPIGNIWLRVSGFGMAGTPAGARKYIEFALRLAALRRPIVGDCLGGITGLGAAAFGGIGGLCNGGAEKENFNFSSLNQPRNGKGGGPQSRIFVPRLDLFLPKSSANVFVSGRGGKSLAACNDRTCCTGLADMLSRPRAHALTQSQRQIDSFNSQPEHSRVDFLLGNVLAEVQRSLRKAAGIKFEDATVSKRMQKHSARADLLSLTLNELRSELRDSVPIARTPVRNTPRLKLVG